MDVVRSPRNGGFSYGCNLGAARGDAPFLLFLNPDARIDAAALDALRRGARRAPRRRARRAAHPASADGDARVEPAALPAAALDVRAGALPAPPLAARELDRRADPRRRRVRAPGTPEWVSGACMLVRRDAFEAIGGFDEGFFLYCEDTDLCRRLRDAGHADPLRAGRGGRATWAAPRRTPASTQAIAARSRVLYARKHLGPGRRPRPGARRGARRGHARARGAPPPRLAARTHGGAARRARAAPRPSSREAPTRSAAPPPAGGAPCSARSRRCATASR